MEALMLVASAYGIACGVLVVSSSSMLALQMTVAITIE
jgi:hypothetical protein